MSEIYGHVTRVIGAPSAIQSLLKRTHAGGNVPTEPYLSLGEIFSVEIETRFERAALAKGLAQTETVVTFHCGNADTSPEYDILADDDPDRIGLDKLCRKLHLDAEVFAQGDDWANHIIIEKGDVALFDSPDYYEPSFEPGEYATFDEWKRANGLLDNLTLREVLTWENMSLGRPTYNVTLTWDELNALEPACVFHIGGNIDTDWSI